MNKNLKIVLITIFVIAFLLFIAYIIMKNTFGINKAGKGSTTSVNPNNTIENGYIMPENIIPFIPYSAPISTRNSTENLALRTYKAATGQNSI